MTVRPQDLQDRRFRVAFRGAARWEVRELLAAVAEDYSAVLADVDRLRADLAAAGSRLIAAREHDREATRVLSQAEEAGRRARIRAEQEAADLASRAEGRMAAMLRELEAERALLEGRIAECLSRQERVKALLQGQLEELGAFLAAEPAYETGVADLVPPEPLPVEAPDDRVAGAPASDAPADESPFSAADVSQALAAATGRSAPEPSGPEPGPGDWPGFDVDEAAAPYSPPQVIAQEDESFSDQGAAASSSLRGRLFPAGIAAAVIVSALASPGSSPAPERPSSRPERSTSTPFERFQAAAAAPLAANASPAAAGASVAPAISPVEPEAPPIPAGTLRVTVEAVRPCWIRLTANGRSTERELQPGETITRDSTTDVVLRAGNAGALVVTLNGRALPPLGREGAIVTRRLTLEMAPR